MNKTTFKFSSKLNEKSISLISKKYDLFSKEIIEKFIMDFEMHYHITQEIDCITRGGMCMPFHMLDMKSKRLSVDIDLFTISTANKIKQIMKKIDHAIPEIKCEVINPINPYPLDNLLSYRIYFNSYLQKNSYIKVDFFHDVDLSSYSEIKQLGFPLFAFETIQDMKILSKGSLLGDKITTLALGTIGLRLDRQAEIAKQIYDLGALLKVTTKDDLNVAFEAFENITNIKLDHFSSDPKYTLFDIITNMSESVSKLLNFDNTVSITQSQVRRFDNFQATYLAKDIYRKTSHVTDVLLINLYIKYIFKHLKKEITTNEAADSFYNILQNMKRIINNEINDVEQMRKLYIDNIPSSINFNKKTLRTALLEHVFLVQALYP